MSDKSSSNSATILFDGPLGLDFVDLVNELQRPFRNIALEFDETAVAEGHHAMFMSEAMVLRVSYAPEANWAEVMRDCDRPPQATVSTALINALLGNVRHALEVTVEGGPGRTLPERTRLAACYHVVRHLLRRHEASLVRWNLNNTLFTAEEFENPTAMAMPHQPNRPEIRETARRSQRPVMDLAHGSAAFSGRSLEVEATHLRLDQSFADAVSQRRADGPESPLQQPIYHDGARDDARLRRARDRIFADDLIEIRDSRRPPPPAQIGLLEQLTVYVMTVTIMVLSFPIGFAMLVYTVLRGENLNATARVMALTGVGVGLFSSPISGALMQMV